MFLQSPAALRIGKMQTDFGMKFPWETLTSDPFERLLLEEAVMLRFEQVRVGEAKREGARAEARAKARANLGK